MRDNLARPKGPNDTQVSLNLPGDWVDDAEKLAQQMSKPGVHITRADALRLAVRTGLDTLLAAEAKKPKR